MDAQVCAGIKHRCAQLDFLIIYLLQYSFAYSTPSILISIQYCLQYRRRPWDPYSSQKTVLPSTDAKYTYIDPAKHVRFISQRCYHRTSRLYQLCTYYSTVPAVTIVLQITLSVMLKILFSLSRMHYSINIIAYLYHP